MRASDGGDMETTAYLFNDNREPGEPFVLFLDGLEADNGNDAPKTVEVRFGTLVEMASTVAELQEDLGDFPLVFGEPEHFGRTREG